MFVYEIECFDSSIGTIDCSFEVGYDIVSDETGTEYDWYADTKLAITVYDDNGEVVREEEIEPTDPLAQEILNHHKQHIVENCRDDYSSSW